MQAIKLRTQRADAINARAEQQSRIGFIAMATVFVAALALVTFVFLRRVLIGPLRQSVARIEGAVASMEELTATVKQER